MVRIYEVYDCNETIAFTRKKEEAIKIRRYRSYTGNIPAHIRQHTLTEPFKSEKYQIPKKLYVSASTYRSGTVDLKEDDILIQTFTKCNDPVLNGVFMSGKTTGVYKSDMGNIYVFFIVDTVPKEMRATLVKRCKRIAIELFREYNVK